VADLLDYVGFKIGPGRQASPFLEQER